MQQKGAAMPLHEAIRELTASNLWDAFVDCVGGTERDVMSALSGRPTGRLSLSLEIASRQLGAEREAAVRRKYAKLSNEIVDAFNARREGGMVLRGFTPASPGRALEISRNLPVEYDFVNDSVRSGEIRFSGVTVSLPPANAVNFNDRTHLPPISEHDLRAFCKDRLSGDGPVPSADNLYKEALDKFSGHRVTRVAIRALHKELVPASQRKQGPRQRWR